MSADVNILSSVTNYLMGTNPFRDGLKGMCGDVHNLRAAGKLHHQTASCSVCSELWGCSKQPHNNTYGVRELQILLNTKSEKTNNSNDGNNYVSYCYDYNNNDNNNCVSNFVRSLSMCIPNFLIKISKKDIDNISNLISAGTVDYTDGVDVRLACKQSALKSEAYEMGKVHRDIDGIYGLGMNNGTENEKPAVILGSARVCTYKPHTSVNRVCEVSGAEWGGDKCGNQHGFLTKATQTVSNALFRVRWASIRLSVLMRLKRIYIALKTILDGSSTIPRLQGVGFMG